MKLEGLGSEWGRARLHTAHAGQLVWQEFASAESAASKLGPNVKSVTHHIQVLT